MAIDPSAILQLLAQMSGGGSPQIRPTSGLREPSLSGLQLGEQGMGLGGGGSLLGGGGGGLGGGGEGGLGLDFFQLMSQLQGAGGVSAPSQNLVGGMSPSTLGFGAGGSLQPQQGSLPQGTLGQAGIGGGQSAAQALATIKELLGLGKVLMPSQSPVTTASPTGAPREPLVSEDATQAFPGAGPAGQIMEGVGGGAPQAFLGAPPAGQIMEGVGGGFPLGFSGAFTPGGPQAISAPFLAGGGPESVGQLASQGLALPSFADLLTGAGIVGGLGTGALALSQGNLGGGLGTLGGLGLGALLGGPFGAALGGGLGGLFGGLFGGGHPTVDVQVPGYSQPIKQTLGGAQTSYKSYGEGLGALSPFEQALQAAQTPDALVTAFNQPYSPFPGQFQIYGNRPGEDPFTLRNLGPTWGRAGFFTPADLMNPAVIGTLGVQAGALGAPAEQPQVAQQVRDYLTSLIGTPFWA